MHPRHINPRHTPVTAATAVSLLSLLFFSFAFSVISLWLGAGISGYIFPIAVVAGVVTGIVAVHGVHDPVNAAKVVFRSVIIIAAAILTGSFTIDYSFDGLYYHQEVIAGLLEGWNPYSTPLDASSPLTPWATHYAKAVEVAATSIVSMTGAIESGKAVNIIAVAAAALAVYAWLSARGGAVTRHRLLLTVATVASPVIWSQIFTYYIDFYKYIYLIFTLLGIIEIAGDDRRSRRRGIIVLGMTLTMAMATKFNMFFEAGVWMLCALLWFALQRDGRVVKTLLLTGLVALIIGAALTVHPYLTNYYQAGHPLYPLMGEGAEDIMTSNTPAAYLDSNRFASFFHSLIIFSIPNPGTLQGGFTMLMPVILLLSAWLLLRLLGAVRGATVYVILIITCSCFFFEQAWWARYVCQLWLVPAILVVASLDNIRSIKTALFTAWLMIFAGVFAAACAVKHMAVIGTYQYSLLQAAASQKEVKVSGEWWGPQFRRHLDEAGAHYIYSTDTDGRDVPLYFHEYTGPILYIDPELVNIMEERFDALHLNFNRHRLNSPESTAQ